MPSESRSLTLAVVQKSPVFLDLSASLDLLEASCAQAAEAGATLVVFGESWLCGYPAWMDHCADGALWGHGPVQELYARMLEQGVTLPGPAFTRLCRAAKQNRITLAVGLNEAVGKGAGQGTLFNSLLILSPKGEVLVHHRKLVPTFNEKLLYGFGDGKGLVSGIAPFGRVGGLICWEHWMPLARHAMHRSGETVHLALWPTVSEQHLLASRHYAFEGRCFVVAAGQILPRQAWPEGLEWSPRSPICSGEEALLRGGSCLIGPDGGLLEAQVFDREELLVWTIPDLNQALRERMTLDTAGHYHRHDVFRFQVSRERWGGEES